MENRDDIIKAYNLNISDTPDTLERLFCASLLSIDIRLFPKVLKRYKELKKAVGINPVATIIPCPRCKVDEFVFKDEGIYCWNCGDMLYNRIKR